MNSRTRFTCQMVIKLWLWLAIGIGSKVEYRFYFVIDLTSTTRPFMSGDKVFCVENKVLQPHTSLDKNVPEFRKKIECMQLCSEKGKKMLEKLKFPGHLRPIY